MKKYLLLITLSSAALSTPAFSQDQPTPAPAKAPEAVKVDTNQLALAVIKDLQKAFILATKVTDKASAEKLAADVKIIAKNFPGHADALSKALIPTEAQIKEMAIHSADHQEKMNEIGPKISKVLTNNGKEVADILSVALSEFHKAGNESIKELSRLYPEDKMKALREAELERREKERELKKEKPE